MTLNLAKRKPFETEKYILPAYWACALINGDTSGMDEREEAQIDAFLEATSNADSYIYCVHMGEDQGFMRWHDAAHYGVLACDCNEFEFVRVERAPAGAAPRVDPTSRLLAE